MLVKLSSWKTIQTSIPTSGNNNKNRRNSSTNKASNSNNKLNVSLWNKCNNKDKSSLKVCVNTPNGIHTYEYSNDSIKEHVNMRYMTRPGNKSTMFYIANDENQDMSHERGEGKNGFISQEDKVSRSSIYNVNINPIYDEMNGIIYSITKNGKGLCYWKYTSNGPSGDLHTQVTLPHKILSMYLFNNVLVGVLENGQLFQAQVNDNTAEGTLDVVLLGNAINTNIANGGTLLFGYVMEYEHDESEDDSDDKMVVVLITQCISGELIVSKYLLQAIMNSTSDIMIPSCKSPSPTTVIPTTLITNSKSPKSNKKKKLRNSEEKEEKKEDDSFLLSMNNTTNSVTTSSILLLGSNDTILSIMSNINNIQFCTMNNDNRTIFISYSQKNEWYGCRLNISICQITEPFLILTKTATVSKRDNKAFISSITSNKIIFLNNKILKIFDIYNETCDSTQEIESSTQTLLATDNCICLYDSKHGKNASVVTFTCCKVYEEQDSILSLSDALLDNNDNEKTSLLKKDNISDILQSLTTYFIPTTTTISTRNGINDNITAVTTTTKSSSTTDTTTKTIEISQEQWNQLIDLPYYISNKNHEKDYINIIMSTLATIPIRSNNNFNLLFQSIFLSGNSSLSTYSILLIIDTILEFHIDDINEYCIILMIHYFINTNYKNNDTLSFLNDMQSYSKEYTLPIIVPMIQNNNNDEEDDDYDHLSQLATSWIYKIITTIPLHANNLNKSLFSSALKSLFISDKSKTNIFHVFHAIVLNNNPVTFEENVNVCFNIVIETFMQEYMNDENIEKSISMLKQKINNEDRILYTFSHGMLSHMNSLFDHNDTTTSDSDGDRISKKRKHGEDYPSSDDNENGYSLEYLIL